MPRCRTVAVASAKGSPGVTFVAAGLACRLAALGVDVLAVDADAEDRTLAALLEAEADPSEASQALGRAAALGLVTPEGLRAATTPAAPRLTLIEAPPVEALEGQSLLAVARSAGYGAVVIDLGHLAGRLQRQLVAGCDWLLWVVLPDRLGLERSDQVIRRADLAAASAGLVLNRIGPAAVRGADRALLERHRLPVMARLRDDARAAARVRLARPPHSQRPFRRAFDELARALHPDLAGRSREVWP